MLIKENEKKKSTASKNMSVCIAHNKLFNFFKPDIKVNIDMKTITSACVDLVTVNGRPYSLLNDSGFRKIIDPIISGLNKKVAINSASIKLVKILCFGETKLNLFIYEFIKYFL